MSTHRHSLIRLNASKGFGPSLSPRGFPGFPPSTSAFEPLSLSITAIEATDAEIVELSREPSVLAVPRAMPISLVAPIASASAPVAAGTAWGVTEVGADGFW